MTENTADTLRKSMEAAFNAAPPAPTLPRVAERRPAPRPWMAFAVGLIAVVLVIGVGGALQLLPDTPGGDATAGTTTITAYYPTRVGHSLLAEGDGWSLWVKDEGDALCVYETSLGSWGGSCQPPETWAIPHVLNLTVHVTPDREADGVFPVPGKGAITGEVSEDVATVIVEFDDNTVMEVKTGDTVIRSVKGFGLVYDNGAAQYVRITLLSADGSLVGFTELGPNPTGEPYRP